MVAWPGFGPGIGWTARDHRSPAFQPLTPISSQRQHTRRMLTGTGGDVAVVYTTFEGDFFRPLVSVRPPGGTFSPPEPPPEGSWSEFALGPDGEVVALGFAQESDADGNRSAVLSIKPRGGTYGTPERLPSGVFPETVAIDGGGRVTVAWVARRPGIERQPPRLMATSRVRGGAFSPPRELATLEGGTDIVLAAAPGGDLAAVVGPFGNPSSDELQGLLVVERPDGTRQELLLPGMMRLDRIAVDATGRFAMSWAFPGPIQVAVAEPGRPPALAPLPPVSGVASSVAIDGLGRPVVVGSGGPGVRTTTLSEGGTWCAPDVVSLDEPTSLPSLAVGQDRGIVAWAVRGTAEVRAARYEGVPGCGGRSAFAEVARDASTAASGRSAAVRTRCARVATCRGRLDLRARGALIGRAAVRIAPARRATVRVKLTGSGRRWLAQSGGDLRATASLKLRGAGRYSRAVHVRGG